MSSAKGRSGEGCAPYVHYCAPLEMIGQYSHGSLHILANSKKTNILTAFCKFDSFQISIRHAL